MKFDVCLTEYFNAPIENVWRAITDPRELARWLMDNDFEARLGARFTLRRLEPVPGWRGWVECEVIELQAPTRMVWSWCDGAEPGTASQVTFELRREGAGTWLTVRHLGEEPELTAKAIQERWPIKVRALSSMFGDHT